MNHGPQDGKANWISHEEESSNDRRKAWSLDIKENIEETEWENACLKAQSQTINTRIKLLQYKMINEDVRNTGDTQMVAWQSRYTCEMPGTSRYLDSSFMGMSWADDFFGKMLSVRWIKLQVFKYPAQQNFVF